MKKIFWYICDALHNYIAKPRMVQGFRHFSGHVLKNTRISNSTIITCPDKLDIEDNVFISHYNYIESSNGVFIGEGCQFAPFSNITTHSSHQSIRLYGRQYIKHNAQHIAYQKGSVKIGKYTFVGPHCTIVPNTIIGKGSLVAAYSFVKGSFPDFAIIAGNPAIVVGDTRDGDKKYLEQYPELKFYYDEWACYE